MSNLLVLFSMGRESPPPILRDPGPWTVLSFADIDSEERFRNVCRAGDIDLEAWLPTAEHIARACPRARERYCRFVADWPDRVLDCGETFKERFRYREIPLWWLSSASAKDNEAFSTFDLLCQFEAIADVLAARTWSQCLLVGGPSGLAALLRQDCTRRGVSYTDYDLKPKAEKPTGYYLLARFWFVIRLTIRWLLFKTALRPDGVERQSQKAVGFLSIYPVVLENRRGRPYDRNYRELPSAIAAAGRRPVFVCEYQNRLGISWHEVLDLWHLRRGNAEISFIEDKLRLADILVVVGCLRFFFQYWLLDRSPGFRASFVDQGINVYELAGREFRALFLGNEVAHHIVIARLSERLGRSGSLSLLVSFLELYPFARAVYYGLKRGDPSVVTVAYQHANITRMKLWYSYQPRELLATSPALGSGRLVMPRPDYYMFQGLTGRDLVLASGYPADRCIVTGSARYDQLAAFMSSSKDTELAAYFLERSGGRKLVLVAPSLSAADARELITVAIQVCAARDDCFLIIKAHPSCPVDAMVAEACAQHSFRAAEISDGDLYDLILVSDVVLVSYSTVGDEAIALKRPVICYSGLRPTMSSYLDVPAAPIAYDADALDQSLTRMLRDDEYRDSYLAYREELISGSFYKLDGAAGHRAADAISHLQDPN